VTLPVPSSVCVIMLTALGDAVHVLPVIGALKRHAPGTRITWIVQPAAASLVQGHAAIDELLVFERHRGWRAFADMRRMLGERRFGAVLLLQPYFKAALLATFARSEVKIGTDRRRARDLSWIATPHRLPARPLAHMQDQFLEFLDPFGIPRDPVVWDLGPWPAERRWKEEFFSRFDRPVVSVVVGTSKPEKDWPAERWAPVIDSLDRDFGLQPILVGGTSKRERAAARTIMERARTRPVSALGSGIRPLVSILDGSALVISPDTGPLHMAVALDRPVISLIGYTDPRRTGPYSRSRELVIDAFHDPGESGPVTTRRRAGRMERISVEDVLEKVRVWKERKEAPEGR
jgi:heptosyltransferase I